MFTVHVSILFRPLKKLPNPKKTPPTTCSSERLRLCLYIIELLRFLNALTHNSTVLRKIPSSGSVTPSSENKTSAFKICCDQTFTINTMPKSIKHKKFLNHALKRSPIWVNPSWQALKSEVITALIFRERGNRKADQMR